MKIGTEIQFCRVINVSKRGLYLESQRRLGVGESVEVELFEGTDDAVQWVFAAVRRFEWTWDAKNDAPIIGFGLELLPDGPSQCDFLSRVVQFASLTGPCEKTVLSSVEGRQQLSHGFTGYQAQLEHQEDEATRPERKSFVTGPRVKQNHRVETDVTDGAGDTDARGRLGDAHKATNS